MDELNKKEDNFDQNNSISQQEESAPIDQNYNNENKNKTYLLIGVSLIIVLCVGVFAYFYLSLEPKNDNNVVKDNLQEESEVNENLNDDNSNTEYPQNTKNESNNKEQIISEIMNLKNIINGDDIVLLREYIGSHAEDMTDEEVLEMAAWAAMMFEDITIDLLNSDKTNYDIQDNTAVVEVTFEDESNAKFYFVKENDNWNAVEETDVEILRAKPLDNISQEISVQPLSNEVFEYYQIALEASEGIEARILMNDIETFIVDGEYITSSKNIMDERLLKSSGSNYIDVAIDSVSSDVESIMFSDNIMEIVIYAVNEQKFAGEEDELIRIDMSDLEVGTTRYNFILGQ